MRPEDKKAEIKRLAAILDALLVFFQVAKKIRKTES